jgi:hypothetical protein
MEDLREARVLPMDFSWRAPSYTLELNDVSCNPAISPMSTPKALSPADDRAGWNQPGHRSIRPSCPNITSPVSGSPTSVAIKTSIAARQLRQSTPANAVLFQGREDVRPAPNFAMGSSD